MMVKCTFDSETDVTRNNNILQVKNCSTFGMVNVQILTVNGEIEEESVVNGDELIRAVQNAMNWREK